LASQKSLIIENAQQFAAKGKIDKAIAEWKKLLAETPQDGNIYNNIADLYLRVNDKANAIDACLKAASAYREAGFELKGVAVLKKILKVDSNRIDIYEMLADINADRGLIGNAVEGYQQTTKLYMKNGNFKAAIGAYQKLEKFSPEDPEIPLAIARLYQKQERFREAIFSYEQAEAIYEKKQMVSEARQVIEEIVKIDPSYLKHLVAKEAMIASISDLTTIDRDITLPPPKNKSESSMFGVEEVREDAFFIDDMDVFKDLIPDDNALPQDSSNKPIVEDVLSALPLQSGSSDVKYELEHQVSDAVLFAHLAEADSYIKYEFYKNAIDKLLLVATLAPLHEEPYIKLKEIYLTQGDKDKAAGACRSLADIYERKMDLNKKEAILRELSEIDPLAYVPSLRTNNTVLLSSEIPDVSSQQSMLLDDLKDNPFLQAQQEASFDPFSELQGESLAFASAIARDMGNLSIQTSPQVLPTVSPIVDDQKAVHADVVQSQKNQQYLETCYQLGVAQKEIGNFAKAIREFEQALDGAERFQEVLSLLASCYAEQGNLAHAASVLQKGVDDPRCNENARLGILYDLASIYGQLDEKGKAFAIYKDIYRVNPNFRDVSGKVKELPYRKPVVETARVKEPVFFTSETNTAQEKTVPVIKEKRRISYV